MQALFARHRTPVYRWLYRLVENETLAEGLLSDVFFDVWQQAAQATCCKCLAMNPNFPDGLYPTRLDEHPQVAKRTLGEQTKNDKGGESAIRAHPSPHLVVYHLHYLILLADARVLTQKD
jgi:hypothetical protein